jgi:hypothetical protein
MHLMMRTYAGVTVALCAFGLAAGCSTSSYQTAKMLQPGATRLSGGLTSYHASADGNDFGEPSYEVMGMHGLSEQLEVGGKFAFVSPSIDAGGGDEDFNLYTLEVIPKVSITPDQLAAVVPVGVMFSDQDGSNNVYLVNPGVVYSQQLNPDFVLDAMAHAFIAINDEFDETADYIGANFGLELSPGAAAWAIHPEVGLLFPINDNASSDGNVDYFFHFGIAVHYRLGGAPQTVAMAPPPPGP